jgi:hypothetical protein
MMPDLPNVGWERDIEAFREFFENPDFRCVVHEIRASSSCMMHFIDAPPNHAF